MWFRGAVISKSGYLFAAQKSAVTVVVMLNMTAQWWWLA